MMVPELADLHTFFRAALPLLEARAVEVSVSDIPVVARVRLDLVYRVPIEDSDRVFFVMGLNQDHGGVGWFQGSSPKHLKEWCKLLVGKKYAWIEDLVTPQDTAWHLARTMRKRGWAFIPSSKFPSSKGG